MRISDWSSDVCSSDLHDHVVEREVLDLLRQRRHEVLERTGIVVEIDEDEAAPHVATDLRSEEHTSELQSLMRISYAVFCLKKKNKSSNSMAYNDDCKYSTTSTSTYNTTHNTYQ